MNMAELNMAVSVRSSLRMSILNQLYEDLKVIFLKCKIRFIYVGFNCKRKKVGQKMSGNLCH